MMIRTCQYCGKTIELRPSGQHFKWFDDRDRWKCLSDPENFPVRSHSPRQDDTADLHREEK